MKYLKCNHCNHFNSIDSEYQIFCDDCGKKIANNFKDWQKKFPSKNFENFKNEIGVKKTVLKSKKKTSLRKLVQISIIVIFSLTGSFLVKKHIPTIFSFFNNLVFPVSEVLNQKWERQFFMGNKVSIESPYWLEKSKNKVSFPDNIQKLIKSINYYEFHTFNNFGAVLLTASYDKSIVKINVQGASDGAIAQGIKELNGTDVFYNDEQTTISGCPTIIKKGTFKTTLNNFNFKTITCVKNDLTLISLMTFWVKDHENYDLLTDRMINSLMIE